MLYNEIRTVEEDAEQKLDSLVEAVEAEREEGIVDETKAPDCVEVKRRNLSANDAHISTAFRTLKPDYCISIIPRVDGFCQYDGGNITELYAWFLEMFL